MKKAIFLIATILVVLSLNAQQKVALVSNGVTTIFGGANPFVDAYEAAIDGDTLYLPGAVLTPPSIINKQLAIYGTGHYPDSTEATGPTVLSGHITLQEGADHFFLEGVKIDNIFQVSNGHKVDNIVVSRCTMSNLKFLGDFSTPCEFVVVKHCVINSHVSLDNASSCLITNNLIGGRMFNGSNNAIYNNIFLHYDYWYSPINSMTNCDIANNIFLQQSGYIHSGTSLNTFSYNVFMFDIDPGSNTFVSNYHNTDLTTLFVDQTGNTFDYTHDYHLVDPDLFPGLDGSEISIYGGLYPYKEGAVPSNPHIIARDIANFTDENGMLEVSISVNAQQE